MKKFIASGALVILTLTGCSYSQQEALDTPNSVVETSYDFWSNTKTFGYVDREHHIIDLPVCGQEFLGKSHCATESGSVRFEWNPRKGGAMGSASITINGEKVYLNCRTKEDDAELHICLPVDSDG